MKPSLKSLRNAVEYEEALKSALSSSASGTYGGMLVGVYVGIVSGSSPEVANCSSVSYPEHVRAVRCCCGAVCGAVELSVELWSCAICG